MANENMEIGDIVKKCKILLLDIEGTTTSISFVKDKLFPYAEENVKQFLDGEWEKEDVKEAVGALRKLTAEDTESGLKGVVAIPGEDASKEDQIEGLVSSVKWLMSSDRKVGPLKQLQGLIWKQGYDKGDIKGHVYEDVSPALQQWRSVDGRRVYIYSSGSVQAQKLLFGQSVAGDLLPSIDGHFDTAVGAKVEPASYTKIVEEVAAKPEEILFLTDIVKEAEAARAAGVRAGLVSREGNAPLPAEATAAFPVLHSLAELTATNKRKPESQDEVPAKVLKTDTEVDVKSGTPAAAPTDKPVPKETGEPEKMDVEETVIAEDDEKTKTKHKDTLTVEEVTDSNDAVGVPVSEAVPIVEEKIEEKETKTEEKETEKMETESEAVKNGEDSTPVPKESPTTVITEIEDVTDNQLGEVAEIIEELKPVVEEPAAVEDMEELQNVGEVLEKECDEILSKVQNVTNLDNIPLKLNPIAEETMETENTDSNDIVDRILDRELELEMKQGDIDLNTVTEITDEAKTEVVEEKSVKSETSPAESNGVPEVNGAEKNVEKNSVTLDKVKEDSPAERKADEVKIEEPKPETDKKEESMEVTSVVETKEMESETEVKAEDKPVIEEVKSVTEEVKIVAAEVKPATEEVKPVAEEVKPVTEEVKPVTEEVKPVTEEVKPVTEEVKPVTEEVKPAAEEVKPATEEVKPATEEVKPATEEVKPAKEEVKPATEEVKSATEDVKPAVVEAKPVAEQAKPASEESKNDNDVKEPQVNGKATNGDAEAVTVNGDATKDDELCSRLSVENGKEVVNGSNGDSMETEEGQGDCKVEAEVSDIKVKTVTTEEPRTDPIEQPTEA